MYYKKWNWIILLMLFISCGQTKTAETKPTKPEIMTENSNQNKNPYYSRTATSKLILSEEEWKKILPSDVFEVACHADTERPFTGKYWKTDLKGTYFCAACGNKLFRSNAKFSSSCGWPSFFEQENKNSVLFKNDSSHGMQRIEALCGRCDSHLGHLFDDGPAPTGKRYCMNSIMLDFEPDTP